MASLLTLFSTSSTSNNHRCSPVFNRLGGHPATDAVSLLHRPSYPSTQPDISVFIQGTTLFYRPSSSLALFPARPTEDNSRPPSSGWLGLVVACSGLANFTFPSLVSFSHEARGGSGVVRTTSRSASSSLWLTRGSQSARGDGMGWSRTRRSPTPSK